MKPPPQKPPAAQPEYDVTQTGLCGQMRMRHGREIKPEMKHEITFELLREFTWRERWYILCGCNVTVKGSILCRHNPGTAAPAATVNVADLGMKKLSLDDLNRQVQDKLRTVFARSQKNQPPTNHEQPTTDSTPHQSA